MSQLLKLDTKIFEFVRGLAQESRFWDQFFVQANKYSVAIFSAALLWYFFRNRRVFWTGLFSALLSRGIFTALIHQIFYRPRPYNIFRELEALIDTQDLGSSFPSGHAAYFFAIAFVVWLRDRKIGGILILGALLFSFARIFLGVHYPLDILGGIVAALISVWIVKRVLYN